MNDTSENENEDNIIHKKIKSAIYDEDFDDLNENLNLSLDNEKEIENNNTKDKIIKNNTIIVDKKENKDIKYISYKFLILGDKQTGKNSIIKGFTGKKYNEIIKEKELTLDNGNKVSIELILEDNDKINTVLNSINGIIFVYTIKDKKTLEFLKKYIEMIQKETKGRFLPKIIFGNMCDLDFPLRQVTTEEGKIFSDEYGMNFYEVTYKNLDTIITPIKDLIKIYEIYLNYKNFIIQKKFNEKQFISNIKKNKISLTKCQNCNTIYNIFVDQYSHCISLYCNKCKLEEDYNFSQYEKLKKSSNIICFECKKNKAERTSMNFCYYCKAYICHSCIKSHNNKTKKDKNKHVLLPYNLVDVSCFQHDKLCYTYCTKCKKNICVKCEMSSHIRHKTEMYNEKEIFDLINRQKIFLKKEKEKYSRIKKVVDDCFNSLKQYFESLISFKEKEMNIKEEMIQELELYKYNKKLIENIKNLEFEKNVMLYDFKASWDQKLNGIFEFFKEPIKIKKVKLCHKNNLNGPFDLLLPIATKPNLEKNNNNISIKNETATDICFLHKYKEINYFCVSFNNGALKIYGDDFDRRPHLIIKELEENEGINSLYKSTCNKNSLFLVGNTKIINLLLSDNLKEYKKIKEIETDNNLFKQILQIDYFNSLIISNNMNKLYIYDMLKDKEIKDITEIIDKKNEKEIISIDKISDNKIIVQLKTNILGNVDIDIGRETMRDSILPNESFDENDISMVGNQRLNSTIFNIKESKDISWRIIEFKENKNIIDINKDYLLGNDLIYLGKISDENLLFYSKKEKKIIVFDFEIYSDIINLNFSSIYIPINAIALSKRLYLLDLLILCEEGNLIQCALNLNNAAFYILAKIKIYKKNIQFKNLIENTEISRKKDVEDEDEEDENEEIIKIVRISKRNYLLINKEDIIYNLKS